jgi:peptide/nickel transport system substrate-binding protein
VRAGLLLVLVLTLSACANPRPTGDTSAPAGSAPQAPSAPKRLVAAIQGSPNGVYNPPNLTNRPRGIDELTILVHAGLSIFDVSGGLHPQLAEAVPSVENGLWRLLPDGGMETTWKIRDGSVWHDGAPFTADDLAFAVQVSSDPDLPAFKDAAFNSIAGADAPDPHTIVIRWKEPFIRADQLFSDRIAIPLPKHILESQYAQTDKANFINLPYWSDDFVGLGPYKVKEFDPGARVVVQANDRYVLGKPKIDEIELQTIADNNAIVAGLLSGSVQVVLGRALSVDQAVTLRDGWTEGKILLPLVSLMSMDPQLLNPTPAVVNDLSFRRAVLMSLDRKEMADAIEYGLLPPADGVLALETPLEQATRGGIVKYAYDPRQAAQMIEALGYTKGGDGFYRDAGGQQLRLELRATQGDINPKTMFAAADFLQRNGIGVDSTVIPLQLATNNEYRATFPAFSVNGQPLSDRQIERFNSANARTAENRYTGDNRARYMNAEMDDLVGRYLTTIPLQPRMEAATGIMRNITTNLPILPLFYDSYPGVQVSRLANAEAAASGGRATWNAYQWDLT